MPRIERKIKTFLSANKKSYQSQFVCPKCKFFLGDTTVKDIKDNEYWEEWRTKGAHSCGAQFAKA